MKPPRSAAEFAAYLRRSKRRSQRAYLVFTPEGALAGVININEIVRGGFCSAYLGYYAFTPHAGKGHMTRGLRLVIEQAFGTLRLHRLEANIQPANSASRRLVRGLRFRREGYSPRYLKIAGRFCDHERWALTVEDWKRGAATTGRRPRAAPRRAQSARARKRAKRWETRPPAAEMPGRAKR